MTTYTPFLRLAKPPFDSMPWDEAINGDMDIIDAFVQRYMAVPNYMGGWLNSTLYTSGQNVLDVTNATIYLCLVTHTSAVSPTTFAQDRTARPTYWQATTNVSSGSSAMTVSDTPPVTSKQGDLWWDSVGAELYVYYNDGGSLQWVVANNQSGMMGEAPNDGNVYGRQRSQWTPVAPGAVGSVGRNLIHNSMMNIAQRGAGPWTVTGYTLDRWNHQTNLDTISVSRQPLTDANRASIGDEAATWCYYNTFTGNAGAASYNYTCQRIEDVRRLAGKTVTVSFWATCGTGLKLGVSVDQSFGTGGSPSAYVSGNGQSVTLTATPTRYSLTFAVPSVSGKTLGTSGGDYTQLDMWFSCGTTFATLAGSIGVQSGSVWLWGVQLEIAAPGQTQPTPLEKPDPQQDLAKCQRFYQASIASFWQGAGTNTIGYALQVNIPGMRATPTATIQNSGGSVNMGSIAVVGATPNAVQVTGTATATAVVALAVSINASADL